MLPEVFPDALDVLVAPFAGIACCGAGALACSTCGTICCCGGGATMGVTETADMPFGTGAAFPFIVCGATAGICCTATGSILADSGAAGADWGAAEMSPEAVGAKPLSVGGDMDSIWIIACCRSSFEKD